MITSTVSGPGMPYRFVQVVKTLRIMLHTIDRQLTSTAELTTDLVG